MVRLRRGSARLAVAGAARRGRCARPEDGGGGGRLHDGERDGDQPRRGLHRGGDGDGQHAAQHRRVRPLGPVSGEELLVPAWPPIVPPFNLLIGVLDKLRFTSYNLLLTTYYLLFIISYLVFTTHHQFFIYYYSLFFIMYS